MQYEYAFVFGRFQGFHVGHIEHISTALGLCEKLTIGISNPDIRLTAGERLNAARSDPTNNPFTYYERMICISEALMALGISQKRFNIVPFPINYPDILNNYVPTNKVALMSIHDNWDRKKLSILKSAGYQKISVMYDRKKHETLATGTDVRRRLVQGEKYDHLVPESTKRLIAEIGLVELKRRIFATVPEQ